MANGRSHGLFDLTGSFRPKRSTFDLSYSKKFDARFGALYPILCDEVVPGDTWHVGNQIVCRVVNPLMAPVMQNWKIYTHYFFVPYRILWDKWEEFISGGINGDSVIEIPVFRHYADRSANVPGFHSEYNDGKVFDKVGDDARAITSFGSISDFLFGIAFEDTFGNIPVEDCPVVFPYLAYLHVYNDYYRDENLQAPFAYHISSGLDPQFVSGKSYQGQLTTVESRSARVGKPLYNQDSKGLLYRNWKKDYFTSALTNQQRGTPPTLRFNLDLSSISIPLYFQTSDSNLNGTMVTWTAELNNPNTSPTLREASQHIGTQIPLDTTGTYYSQGNTKQPVDTGITVSDLRFVTQIQKWQERNMRGGVRYTEFLSAHFGISPRDDRMMRPEYLGGSVQPIVVSEVLQTSPSSSGGVDTSLGRLGGHGLSVNSSHCCDYTASEYGLILGLMSIMPEPEYQQGLDRQWSRKSKYDYYFPEFKCLSEQEIRASEIKIGTDHTANDKIFGYQGRFDEMRYKKNQTCGQLRHGGDFDYYTMSRYFNNSPELNSSFIVCNPDIVGLFHDDTTNPFLINFGNIIKCTRPIMSMATPGMLDHF